MTAHYARARGGGVSSRAIDGDELSIEAVGEFTFEEFGIEPYSAFLGSVKNKNEFFIYLNLKAIRTNESSDRGTDDR